GRGRAQRGAADGKDAPLAGHQAGKSSRACDQSGWLEHLDDRATGRRIDVDDPQVAGSVDGLVARLRDAGIGSAVAPRPEELPVQAELAYPPAEAVRTRLVEDA